ncbi:NAD(P)-dependent oxidoreductase [Actinomadura bangladeshensis]|uniref:NAD(P)-dependent oxidoreductase n=1 Tax=Actinomadura bangladeshensis TaxID=453573 RepID=A0A4R4NVY4_9ACTN|nr:NAD(P)-binding domain-containing protein [Actinomadura bangladeshensis]TDC12227.1 NAD(P)-dependent oxidoreductase [Actinomadura bangladeshensis]
MGHDSEQISVLGLGAMGTAIARAWLAAGYQTTVWNRTASRAEPLVAEGAKAAATAAEAVAASDLVIVCLLDDASVGEALADAGLAGKDLVNITTGTPGDARERAEWAAGRGARYLDGGIMAVPPMIGVPESGAYVFYSGSPELFAERRVALSIPAAAKYIGEDAGSAALHDVALLSAMTGMFAGIAHAFALTRGAMSPKEFAPPLIEWLTAMAGGADEMAAHLETGDYTLGVTSDLAMMVQGNRTLLRTAEEQGVGTELLTPFMALMERRLADGHPDEGTAGVVDLLLREP